MMKRIVPALLFLFTLSLLPTTLVWAQCTPTVPVGPEFNFQFVDALTKQPITGRFLCLGRKVRIVDRSVPKPANRRNFYKIANPSAACSFAEGDTSVFFTPEREGPLVVSINVNANAGSGSSSGALVVPPAFEVKASPPPTFTLQACGPGTVQVTVTDRTYDSYTVQVGSGPAVAVRSGTQTTFPVTGVTTVTVAGSYVSAELCTNSAQQSFTPLPAPQQPVMQRLAVSGSNTLQFQFAALQPAYTYSLQVADGAAPTGYRTVATVPAAATSYTLAATTPTGCYRLLLTDACQPSTTALSSTNICAVALTATSLDGRNRLTWATSQPGSFVLTRNGQTLRTLPAGTTQYEDPDVTCGEAYTYQLTAVSGSVASVSNEATVTTVSTLAPPAPRLSASFNLRNQVELTAVVPGTPTGGQLTYLRNGSELRTTPNRTLRDSINTLTGSLCYSALFQNACGNRSSSSPTTCPVLLTASSANQEGTLVSLTWTAFQGPDPAVPVSYRVVGLGADGAALGTIAAGTSLAISDLAPLISQQNQQVLRYRIEVTGGGLASPSYSNIATVARALKLFVPTAFTPNGDGLNDVLELKGSYLDNFRFVVIDRNGQEVFKATTRNQTWDGRIGTAAPVPGAYVWRFEANDQANQHVVRQGTVTILR
ncbi:T9SS type B sorting domain-containing protein [Hymenobacter taeanensis]|uniref:T9SS type B sorting domain-containing protein n=1 Tax=Hymenobacter taeanensis TaxID=2735321 RepID=A0A6M6BKC4_9BACT|nr:MULTISPECIES: gliding motility-associated C-terminal domain-containing protein [Hymenobacter]QJX48274.1 T9SS type B sorting domain-containing protein [Hymenobacter taeanensis]UOQ82243.1 gliding motility-associated C-terminal domain-containing protein [Hymenobacter sp. 5414T-23]